MIADMKKILSLLLALMLVGCECPYEWDKNSPYHRNQERHLTADDLTGLWQCYYPMYVGNVEFKEVSMFSNGRADIIMEEVGGSAYYAETYKWRYDGKYLSFTRGTTTYQFQVTGYLWPEIYLRDYRGKYTWACRRPESCIN